MMRCYRPSWDKCADVISGGFMRWKELSEGKTSDQLMYVLLEEIQGDQGEGGNTADFFDGQVSYSSATCTCALCIADVGSQKLL